MVVGGLKFQFSACPYSSSSDSSPAELGPAMIILPQHSLQICHQHTFHKAQICLQLGIRPKFRNKWSQETALMIEVDRFKTQSLLKPLHATWQVSLYRPLDRQCGKAAHCNRMEQSGNIRTFSRKDNPLSPEDLFENIEAILI